MKVEPRPQKYICMAACEPCTDEEGPLRKRIRNNIGVLASTIALRLAPGKGQRSFQRGCDRVVRREELTLDADEPDPELPALKASGPASYNS